MLAMPLYTSRSELLQYGKTFLLPITLVKILSLYLIFSLTPFQGNCSIGDYFAEIYYLVLLSIFLIPLSDFPTMAILSFNRVKTGTLLNRFFYAVFQAFQGSLLIGVFSIFVAVVISLSISFFRLEGCTLTN